MELAELEAKADNISKVSNSYLEKILFSAL
jgi:hypothetical protein